MDLDLSFDKTKIITNINYDKFNLNIQEKDRAEFFGECGNTHYRFLAYISTFFNDSTFFDFSTDSGLSALALFYNETNRIDRKSVV